MQTQTMDIYIPQQIDLEKSLRNDIHRADWTTVGKTLKSQENTACPYQLLLDQMKDIACIDKALDILAKHQLSPHWAYTAKYGINPYISNQIRWLTRLTAERPEWVANHGKWLSTCMALRLNEPSKLKILTAMDYALGLIQEEPLKDAVFDSFFCDHISECYQYIDWSGFLIHKWLYNGPQNTDMWVSRALNKEQIQVLGTQLAKHLPHKHAPKEDVCRYITGLTLIQSVAGTPMPVSLTKEHVFKALDADGNEAMDPDFIQALLAMLSDHIFLSDETHDPSWCMIALYLWSELDSEAAVHAIQDICQQHSRNAKKLINNSIKLLFSQTLTGRPDHRRIAQTITDKLDSNDPVIKMILSEDELNTHLVIKLIKEGKSHALPEAYLKRFITECPSLTVPLDILRWIKNIYRDPSHPLHHDAQASVNAYSSQFNAEHVLSKVNLMKLININTLHDDDYHEAKKAFFLLLSLNHHDFYDALARLHTREDVAAIISLTGVLPYDLLPYASDPIQRDGIIRAM